MLEKRWNPTVCAAVLFLGLLAVRPSGAAVCEINWSWRDNVVTTTDVNGDGAVDGMDFGVLLSEWGTCPGCAADFNENDRVDCVDREFLLGNWGRCDPVEDLSCEDIQTLKDAIPLCTVLNEWADLLNLPYSMDGNVPSFDLDTSGLVDTHDVNIVHCLLNTSGSTPPYADVNFDGTVNSMDLGLVAGAVGRACPDPNQDGKIGWPDVYVLIDRWKP